MSFMYKYFNDSLPRLRVFTNMFKIYIQCISTRAGAHVDSLFKQRLNSSTAMSSLSSSMGGRSPGEPQEPAGADYGQ